jgi:hypothetical protein
MSIAKERMNTYIFNEDQAVLVCHLEKRVYICILREYENILIRRKVYRFGSMFIYLSDACDYISIGTYFFDKRVYVDTFSGTGVSVHTLLYYGTSIYLSACLVADPPNSECFLVVGWARGMLNNIRDADVATRCSLCRSKQINLLFHVQFDRTWMK